MVNDEDEVQIVDVRPAKKPRHQPPDIMSVLLAHEKKQSKVVIPGAQGDQSDTSESGDEANNVTSKLSTTRGLSFFSSHYIAGSAVYLEFLKSTCIYQI